MCDLKLLFPVAEVLFSYGLLISVENQRFLYTLSFLVRQSLYSLSPEAGVRRGSA
jgi:hypothetical protein